MKLARPPLPLLLRGFDRKAQTVLGDRSFVAALELARQGRVEIDQDQAFAPLMVRSAAPVRAV